VSSEYVKEGDSVTLSCDSRGHPDVTFSWLINEQIEKSQQKSDLKLNNVKPEDSGEYYCETKNKHGTMKSNMIIIDVKCEFYVLMPTPINNLLKSLVILQSKCISRAFRWSKGCHSETSGQC